MHNDRFGEKVTFARTRSCATKSSEWSSRNSKPSTGMERAYSMENRHKRQSSRFVVISFKVMELQ